VERKPSRAWNGFLSTLWETMVRLTRIAPEEWRAHCVSAEESRSGSPASFWRLAVPFWFDAAIGYWTGEPDWALLAAALERALVRWEVREALTAASEAASEGAGSAWLPSGERPGAPLLLVGRQGSWLVRAEPSGTLYWAVSGGEELLREWAESEGLELVKEDEGGWP
jgi:hypothetical protein